jgi:hypothetical protein
MGGCSVTLQQPVKEFSLRLRILRLLGRRRMPAYAIARIEHAGGLAML